MKTAKWLPTRYTKPLSEDFPTSGGVVIGLAEKFMSIPEQGYKPLVLTEWQKWLINSALERYPSNHSDPEKAGRLRYKQVVISMPRKQGKTLLGSLFTLFFIPSKIEKISSALGEFLTPRLLSKSLYLLSDAGTV